MGPNRGTVPRPARHLEDIQALHPLISRNMVVCLNNKDLNQPDLWLTSSLQANSLANKALMVVRQPSRQPSIRIHRWATAGLPALAAMAVALSRLPMLSGVLPQPKISGTDLVATRGNWHLMPCLDRDAIGIIACLLREFGTSSPGTLS
jgi:hypothetical protein